MTGEARVITVAERHDLTIVGPDDVRDAWLIVHILPKKWGRRRYKVIKDRLNTEGVEIGEREFRKRRKEATWGVSLVTEAHRG